MEIQGGTQKFLEAIHSMGVGCSNWICSSVVFAYSLVKLKLGLKDSPTVEEIQEESLESLDTVTKDDYRKCFQE